MCAMCDASERKPHLRQLPREYLSGVQDTLSVRPVRTPDEQRSLNMVTTELRARNAHLN